MEKESKIDVIIVDDHKMVINGLVSILKQNKNIFISEIFYNVQDLLHYLSLNKSNIILLDINLPDINGIEACKIICRLYPTINILVLTNYDEINFVKIMLKHGAKGYLVKSTAQEELLDAIEAINQGAIYLPKNIKQKLIENESGLEKVQKTYITRDEKLILEALNNGSNLQQVSKKLQFNLDVIENHIRNLFKKFNVASIDELVKVSNKTTSNKAVI